MSQRLAPVVAPVCLVGLGSVLAAAVSFATKDHPASLLLGVTIARSPAEIGSTMLTLLKG